MIFWGILFIFCQISMQRNLNNSLNLINDINLNQLLQENPFGIKNYVKYKIEELPKLESCNKKIINITIPLFSTLTQLQLKLNPFSTTKNFEYVLRSNNATKILNHQVLKAHHCFYSTFSHYVRASIDICDGLNGIIVAGGAVYAIKPLPQRYQKSNSTKSHIIIKTNSYEPINEKSINNRKKRAIDLNKEIKIETAVFVDKDLYRHMQNNFSDNIERNIFRFVLAMINAVQLLYHDSSLEYKISFMLKRLEILHSDPPELQRSHDIDRYLSSFCFWQEKENVSREKNFLHWDHALMLTGLDLYVIAKNGKFSNQVLGLAPVAGMCKPSSSCTVNEGLHFESIYVVAHEIGHNLGMRHDGPSADNNCDANSHLMSPTLGSGKSSWSTCSNHYLQKFLQSAQAKCLFESSYIELDHTEGGTLPGERFDPDIQCRLKYGKQSERSPTQNIEEICRDLRCTKERYTWTSHPALEGTKCGSNKWCRFGHCVDKDQFAAETRTINGGWSEWGSYTECASACLQGNHPTQEGSIGFAIATRKCNNPRPEFGGKQCLGDNKKYQTCEALQCSNIPPITITEFAEQICRRARDVDKDLTGLGFQKNSSDAEEACTVWCYQYNGVAKTRGWTFPDGTSCHFKRYSPNPMYCVSGRCEEFYCPPTNKSFISKGSHCQIRLLQKKSTFGWTTVGPCRYNCISSAMGLRVLKRGLEYNIQLCQPICNKKKTLFEYATNLCSKYKERVSKLSGLGLQLSAALAEFGKFPFNTRALKFLEDPDRPCHVACQDEKVPHRFYLVTGEDGWFPFGADCARGIPGKKAYCISGRCLEFGKNNMPSVESEFTFPRVRSRRSLEFENRTVTATIDLTAVRRVIEVLNKGTATFSQQPTKISIDFDNPIHIKPDWKDESETLF